MERASLVPAELDAELCCKVEEAATSEEASQTPLELPMSGETAAESGDVDMALVVAGVVMFQLSDRSDSVLCS